MWRSALVNDVRIKRLILFSTTWHSSHGIGEVAAAFYRMWNFVIVQDIGSPCRFQILYPWKCFLSCAICIENFDGLAWKATKYFRIESLSEGIWINRGRSWSYGQYRQRIIAENPRMHITENGRSRECRPILEKTLLRTLLPRMDTTDPCEVKRRWGLGSSAVTTRPPRQAQQSKKCVVWKQC